MPVCIAGMHRSGTSMVARLLHEGGLFLGDEAELMPAADENPDGFWEHADLVALNDALLASLGGAWDLPPDPPVDWASARFDHLRTAAGGLLARFVGHEPWGWKDPRNSLVLPFWRTVTGPLAVVCVVRNPLEVALSLQRRNQFSLPLGLWLWYAYNSRLRADTAPSERVVTHFDRFFGNAAVGEIRRLLAAVGLPADEARAAALAGNARAGLKHHAFTIADLIAANVAPEVVDLYLELCEEAEYPAGEPAARPRPTGGYRASSVGADGPAGGIARIDLWFAEQQHRLAEARDHQRMRHELEARLAERDGMLAERDGKIAEREGRIADRDGKLAEVNRAFLRAGEDQRALRQTVAEQAARIEALSQQAQTMLRHEADLRDQLALAHDQLLNKDLEILGTMGAVLARYAPGAPAAIYYRQVVERVRATVQQHVPDDAPVLVASYGDPEMLDLGRPAADFPQADGGVAADYTDTNNAAAIAQLEELRAAGAAYLIVPSPAQPWLARQRELERYLDDTFPAIVRELGLCTIYALRPPAEREAAAD